MASATAPAPTLALSDAQAQTLRQAALIAAGVLLLLAAAKVLTSALTIFDTTLLALLGVVEGALAALLALILIKIATDLRYAREVPKLSGVHFLNALASWQDFCKTLIGLGVVALLAATIRYSM